MNRVFELINTGNDRPTGYESGLVSVIIPNFNQVQYVKNAIQSVRNQTYTHHEIIVVDDGSTDGSRLELSELSGVIKYIWQENQGLAGARNTGIKAASGEFIGLLDADDEWLPIYLEEMIALSEKFPETAVFFCGAQAMDSRGNDLPQFFGITPVSVDKIRQALLRANFIIPSTVTMKRSVFGKYGMFDQTLRSCEDWDYWLRILPEEKMMGIDENLVRYRIHDNSLSTNPSGMQKATRLVIEKHFGLDDGNYEHWSRDKRRAYGGAYRYHALTSIQRQSDWDAGAKYLTQALQIDPSLAEDLDLFYEIALGTQPYGYRGTDQHVSLDDNLQQIELMLESLFSSDRGELRMVKNKTRGTAYYAIGLAAYNCDEKSISRSCFLRAVWFRPELLFDRRILSSIFKSYLSKSVIIWLKGFKMGIRSTGASERSVD